MAMALAAREAGIAKMAGAKEMLVSAQCSLSQWTSQVVHNHGACICVGHV